MSQYAELFQKLVSLPNSPSKEVGDSLLKCLAEMKRLAEAGTGDFAGLLSSGKSAYLELLSSRCKNYTIKINSYSEKIKNYAVAPHAEPAVHELRDFYHNAYYALFYLARYLLIDNGFHDCSDHNSMPTALAKLKLSVDSSKFGLIELMRGKLGTWQGHRNDADYIMSMERISGLTNTALIQSITGDMETLSKGILP